MVQSSVIDLYLTDILHAVNPTSTPSAFASRFVGLLCITFALILHGTKLQWGLRLQNTLGIFKIIILVAMALSGLGALAGIPGFVLQAVRSVPLSFANSGSEQDDLNQPPRNFEWGTMWKGSLSGGANAFVTGLYNVIW